MVNFPIYRKIKKFISENISFSIIAIAYAALMVSVIDWGTPNEQHPFTYHMDEWHQLQAVKATFKHWTPNIEGAAHGTMFHFLLTGVYLIPFYVIGIIDPFVIKSGLSTLDMQTKIFEILRLNTIIFGVLSLFVLNEIIKRFFKINPTNTLVLFTFTPVWIYLSNYFKYDIALTFWILTAMYFLLRFGANPTLRNYLYAGAACALALSVKLSAIPLLAIYIFSFFFFSSQKKRAHIYLLKGISVFFVVFLLFGIPDVVLGKANYGDFLSSNLIAPSSITDNFLLDYRPWWIYTILAIMPLNFGQIFFPIFVLGLLFWAKTIAHAVKLKNFFLIRYEFFIFISFLIFLLSLWQLKIGATGNRLLVLLPFFAILGGLFIHHTIKHPFLRERIIIIPLLLGIFTFQLLESLSIIYIKHGVDVRQISSEWMANNIKEGTKIGVENIPIYQLLPDIAVREFYEKQEHPQKKTNFQFEVIDVTTKQLPSVLIITNKEFEGRYLQKSAKKDLLQRLSDEGYTTAAEFKPSGILYLIMKNELRMNTSGLVPIPTITVYVKHRS